MFGFVKLLGVDDWIGLFEVGKYVDFVVVDLSFFDFGLFWYFVCSYVFVCLLCNFKCVYVGGEFVSENGVLINLFVGEVLVKVCEVFELLVVQYGYLC